MFTSKRIAFKTDVIGPESMLFAATSVRVCVRFPFLVLNFTSLVFAQGTLRRRGTGFVAFLKAEEP